MARTSLEILLGPLGLSQDQIDAAVAAYLDANPVQVTPDASANAILLTGSLTPAVGDKVYMLWRQQGVAQQDPVAINDDVLIAVPAGFTIIGTFTWSGDYGPEASQHCLLYMPSGDAVDGVLPINQFAFPYAAVDADDGHFIPVDLPGLTRVGVGCGTAEFTDGNTVWIGWNNADEFGASTPTALSTQFRPQLVPSVDVLIRSTFNGLLAGKYTLDDAMVVLNDLSSGNQYTPVALAVTDITEGTVTYKKADGTTGSLNADDGLSVNDVVLVVNSSPASVRTFNGEDTFSDPVPADPGFYVTTSDVDGGTARALEYEIDALSGLAFWLNPPAGAGNPIAAITAQVSAVDGSATTLGVYTQEHPDDPETVVFSGVFDSLGSPFDAYLIVDGDDPSNGIYTITANEEAENGYDLILKSQPTSGQILETTAFSHDFNVTGFEGALRPFRILTTLKDSNPAIIFQDIPSGSSTNLLNGLLKASGDMGAGDGSANMPNPGVQGQGVPITVTNYGTTNNITVAQFDSETIDGDTAVVIAPGTSRTFELFTDGNWHTTALSELSLL